MNFKQHRTAASILLSGLFLTLSSPLLAESIASRTFNEGRPNIAQRFMVAETAKATKLDLSGEFRGKRQSSPPEDRAGLIRVSTVADLTGASVIPAWTRAADGSFVGRFELRADGAIGIRARLEIPRQFGVGEVRVAGNTDGRVEWMPVTGIEHELWTPYTEGSMQTVELRIRSGQPPGVGAIGIGSLMHFDRDPLNADLPAGAAKEASGTCNIDVKCSSAIAGLDSALEQRKRSVALLQFRVGNSGFVCTGTLINSDRFPRAFLLTANHCISTAAAATSLTTFWFYENVACGQRDTGQSQRIQLAGGAQLVQTNYMVDSTLLELNGTPPNGSVYSGWNAADLADNTPIVSVSHPRGDPMKYAEGSVTEPRVRVAGYPIDMYGVTFTRGVIEGGSSGSGLFTLSPTEGLQLRGILSGTTVRQAGGLSCTNLNELGLYGRFEAFYPTIRTTIQNVAQTTQDIDPSMPSLASRPLAIVGSAAGAIDFAGDVDVFQVNISTPGHITIYSTGGNDLVGALLASDGSGLIAVDDVESRNNEFGFTYRVTQPGVYYVSVGHWDPTVASGSYQIHARFSSAQDNYSDIWWNANESGWGLALNHQDNVLAGVLYTFDTDGQPLFLVLNGATRDGSGEYVGNLTQSNGPVFNALPWTASQVSTFVVGTMRLAFPTKNSLNIIYTVNGVSVSKSLTRLAFSTPPTCKFDAFDRTYATNFQDIWWNPNESGWGVNIIHQGDFVAVGLYTYDASNRNVWYLMAPGIRQGSSSTYVGALKKYTGPVFSASPWTAVTETEVGTMSLTFTNGNQATMNYTLNGQPVSKQIQRLTFASPMTECER